MESSFLYHQTTTENAQSKVKSKEQLILIYFLLQVVTSINSKIKDKSKTRTDEF